MKICSLSSFFKNSVRLRFQNQYLTLTPPPHLYDHKYTTSDVRLDFSRNLSRIIIFEIVQDRFYYLLCNTYYILRYMDNLYVFYSFLFMNKPYLNKYIFRFQIKNVLL